VFSLMAAQSGLGGETLNIRPRFIVAAPGMEGTLATLRNTMNSADPTDPSTGRIVTLTPADRDRLVCRSHPCVHDHPGCQSRRRRAPGSSAVNLARATVAFLVGVTSLRCR
jgi:hypothetical protein